MTKPYPRAAFVVFVLLAVATLSMFAAACADADEQGAGSTRRPARATPVPLRTPDVGAQYTTIATAEPGHGSGRILVTWEGWTLYTFDDDVAGSGSSACDDTCADAWPPLSASDPTASDEAPGELGTITRADGSPQVTYRGKPLYLYAADASYPGGDGIGGIWHIARP